MKAWQMQKLGDPWEDLTCNKVNLPAVSDAVCRVQVEAADLNFADILQCQGNYQVRLEPPFTPGMNAAGTVMEAGENSRFKPGDKIVGPCYKTSGGYAEECLIAAKGANLLPEGVDPMLAAAIHVTYGTGWFGLHLRGELQPSDSVLVLAGAGGVGSAAIDLARVHGCQVIAAAGGSEKTAACRALGAEAVVDYNAEDLYERVMEITDGRGVDVVYDPVGGDYFDVARRLVAWEGRYLIIGFAAGRIPTAPMNHALVKNYSLVGVHMGGYRGRDDMQFQHCYRELYQMVQAERLNPLIDKVIGFDELPATLLQLANRETKGELFLTQENSVVRTTGWPARYNIIALAAAAVFICYMDRVIISIAIIPMSADFGWTPEEQGRVLSSFFIGYLLTQVAGGWLAERYGGKIVLGFGVVFWSLFTLLTPVAAAGGLTALLVARVLMGIGEGITFPSIYAMFGRWIPESERSRAIGILFSTIPLGSVFALVATPWIVTHYGWEMGFYAFGAIGFVWWIFWQKLSARSPDEHPRISEEEMQLIQGDAEVTETPPPPIKALLKTPAVWAIIIGHFCANWGTYVLLAWMPTYINKGLGVDFASVGIFTMIPSLFSFLALNAGGWLADYLIRQGHDKTRVRKTMQAVGFGGSAAVLAVVGYVESIPLAIALMSLGNIFGGAMAGGFGVNHLDIAPRGAGVIMGLSNTAGTLPGIIGVYISGLILQATGSWALVFQTAAGVLTFGLVFYLIFARAEKLFD